MRKLPSRSPRRRGGGVALGGEGAAGRPRRVGVLLGYAEVDREQQARMQVFRLN
jgi:hypothetical protein